MKKLMFAVSAALCAAVGFSDVTSANIVGYNTVTLTNGYNMLAVNFQTVDQKEINIQDLIPGTTEGLKGATSDAKADVIKMWKPAIGDYVTYYLYYNSKDKTHPNNYKWCLGNDPADVTFKNGDAFWFKKYGEGTVTVSLSGGVSLENNKTVNIVQGYNMIGNGFPVNFNPNSLGSDFWMGLISEKKASGATSDAKADVIKVWDTDIGDYTTYYLYYNSKDKSHPNNGKWCLGNDPVGATEEFVKPSAGAWYKHYGEAAFSFDIPSPLEK